MHVCGVSQGRGFGKSSGGCLCGELYSDKTAAQKAKVVVQSVLELTGGNVNKMAQVMEKALTLKTVSPFVELPSTATLDSHIVGNIGHYLQQLDSKGTRTAERQMAFNVLGFSLISESSVLKNVADRLKISRNALAKFRKIAEKLGHVPIGAFYERELRKDCFLEESRAAVSNWLFGPSQPTKLNSNGRRMVRCFKYDKRGDRVIESDGSFGSEDKKESYWELNYADRYSAFLLSSEYAAFKLALPASIGEKLFFRLVCPSVRNVKQRDCADTVMTEASQLAISISDAVGKAKAPSVFNALEQCPCAECTVRRNNPDHPRLKYWHRVKKHMGGTGLVGDCLCRPVESESLSVPGPSGAPLLHKASCSLDRCTECGVDTLIEVDVAGTKQQFTRFPSKCPLLFGYESGTAEAKLVAAADAAGVIVSATVLAVSEAGASGNVAARAAAEAALVTAEAAAATAVAAAPLSFSTKVVSRRLYEKASRSGISFQDELTESFCSLKELLDAAVQELPEYIRHYTEYSLINMVRSCQAGNMQHGDLLVLTDFAAVYSILAQDRKCCAQDKHIVLDVFVVLSDARDVTVKNKAGVEVTKKVVTCTVFGFWADTKSKVKLQDERLHSACFEEVLKNYPGTVRLLLHTDNSPTQYKNRYAIYNFARLLKMYGIARGYWGFAVVGNFKGTHDQAGFVLKQWQRKRELYGFHENLALDLATRAVVADQRPTWKFNNRSWKDLEEEKHYHLLSKGTYSYDSYKHGHVYADENDHRKATANPGVIGVTCERKGDGKRDYQVSEVPRLNRRWVFTFKLEEQTTDDEYKIRTSRLPCTCDCSKCRTFDYHECVEVASGARREHAEEEVTMQKIPVHVVVPRKARKLKELPNKLFGKVVVVRNGEEGWDLALVTGEEKVKRRTKMVQDLGGVPPVGEDRRALPTDPGVFVVERDEFTVNVQMFSKQDGTFSKIDRRSANVTLLRKAVVSLVEEKRITWAGEVAGGNEFELADSVITRITEDVVLKISEQQREEEGEEGGEERE